MDMTVKDLLGSAEFKRIFRKHTETYRRKFTMIASKADALTLDISDPILLKILLKPSWNWAGFFATSFWGVYWRLRLGWVFVGVSFVLVGLDYFPGVADFIPSLQFVGFGFAVFFGLYGNSILFRDLIRRARENRLASFSPSYSIAFAVMIVTITIPIVLAVGDLGSPTHLITLLKDSRMITH